MGVAYRANTLVRTGAERATLVRRTYALIFASVIITMLGVAVGFASPALMTAVIQHPFLSFIAVLAPLFLVQRVHGQFPANIGLTFLFALAEGVWLAPFLALYEQMQPGVVGQAGILTFSTFGLLTAYAFVSRRDFSAWGSFLTVGVWVLLGTLILNFFFHNPTADLWISAVGVLLFGGLVVYRTWQVRNVLGPDDYVEAAISIYLALLNMFIFLLSLLGGGRSRR